MAYDPKESLNAWWFYSAIYRGRLASPLTRRSFASPTSPVNGRG